MFVVSRRVAFRDLRLHGAGKTSHQGRDPGGYLGRHGLRGVDEYAEKEVDDHVDAGTFQQPGDGAEEVP